MTLGDSMRQEIKAPLNRPLLCSTVHPPAISLNGTRADMTYVSHPLRRVPLTETRGKYWKKADTLSVGVQYPVAHRRQGRRLDSRRSREAKQRKDMHPLEVHRWGRTRMDTQLKYLTPQPEGTRSSMTSWITSHRRSRAQECSMGSREEASRDPPKSVSLSGLWLATPS